MASFKRSSTACAAAAENAGQPVFGTRRMVDVDVRTSTSPFVLDQAAGTGVADDGLYRFDEDLIGDNLKTMTPEMAHLVDFFNERRWLSWDLLCGMVGPGHALYDFMLQSGAAPEELQWFRDNPCPPDVIGVNYYITSERWLDHRGDRYPAHYVGPHGFADIETARALNPGIRTVVRTHSEEEADLLRQEQAGKIFIGEQVLADGDVREPSWSPYRTAR